MLKHEAELFFRKYTFKTTGEELSNDENRIVNLMSCFAKVENKELRYQSSQLKEENIMLLDALRWITQIGHNPGISLKMAQIAKDAIQKAEIQKKV